MMRGSLPVQCVKRDLEGVKHAAVISYLSLEVEQPEGFEFDGSFGTQVSSQRSR